jgi:hypothetical protein
MKNRKSFSNRKSGGIVLGFKEEYDSFIHPIPTDSSYVFWFRISRELLGLDEHVVDFSTLSKFPVKQFHLSLQFLILQSKEYQMY